MKHSRLSSPRAPARPRRSARSECLACRTLVSIARQRKGFDPEACKLVFAHLDATLAIQSTLQDVLAEQGLSELQFAVLVALFALDPEPVIPADLADYAAVSRAAVTDALARLEAHGMVYRTRDTIDRRSHHLQLTERGRDTTDAALARYLGAIGGIARHLGPSLQGELLSTYQKLQRGAAAIAR